MRKGGLRPVLACFLRDLAYHLTLATATDIARLFVEGGSLDIASQSFFLAGLLKPFKQLLHGLVATGFNANHVLFTPFQSWLESKKRRILAEPSIGRKRFIGSGSSLLVEKDHFSRFWMQIFGLNLYYCKL